jgi:hypothetical protein
MCALDADGNASCWGCANDDQPAGRFLALDLEYYHACGVTTGGEGLCWSWGPGAPAEALVVPDGEWVAVDAGGDGTCFLSTSGTVECSGGQEAGEDSGPWDPDGVGLDVSTGANMSCAVVDGAARCYGSSFFYGCSVDEAATATAIDVAGYAACVLLSEGATSCWGGGYPDDDGGDPTCRRGDAARVFGR